jgi:hypothetical protein
MDWDEHGKCNHNADDNANEIDADYYDRNRVSAHQERVDGTVESWDTTRASQDTPLVPEVQR